MSTDNKQLDRGTNRLLRVGVLTLTVLGPLVNAVIERMRARTELMREQAEALRELSAESTPTYADDEDKLAAGDSAVSARLAELRDQARSQQLRQRGEELAGELMERSGKLSQMLVHRSSKVTRGIAEQGSKATQAIADRSSDLLERSSKASQELLERGGKASQELLERGGKATKNITKRGRESSRSLIENRAIFWITFGTGLTAASIAAYLLVRRRMQQASLEAEQPIELSHNGHLNNVVSSTATDNRRTTTAQGGTVVQNQTGEISAAEESSPAVAVAEPETVAQRFSGASTETERSNQQAPAHSAFLGVVSTKRYYPVETPLDQLATEEDGSVDVIYFSTEQEAQAQGYSSAEL